MLKTSVHKVGLVNDLGRIPIFFLFFLDWIVGLITSLGTNSHICRGRGILYFVVPGHI